MPVEAIRVSETRQNGAQKSPATNLVESHGDQTPRRRQRRRGRGRRIERRHHLVRDVGHVLLAAQPRVV